MGTAGAVGAIYGDVGSTAFDVAVSDGTLKRLDYVQMQHEGRWVLGLVDAVTRRSGLTFEQALSGSSAGQAEQLAARVHVIGTRDERGRVQTPRTPFVAGTPVHRAGERLVTDVLGLEPGRHGAFVGRVKGLDLPVYLNLNTLAQKHVSVLAKTGAGKSYTVGVLLEEFLAAGVPMVILDPHGEYGSLRSPNLEEGEIEAMARFGVKPRSFQDQVQEFAVDSTLNPDAQPLRLEGVNLAAREIADMLPAKLSGGQVGVLYQAVKDVEEVNPAYTLQDIIAAVQMNKSSAKWNVLNALEALASTKLFHVRGTPPSDLVKPKQCTVINLRGVPPDLQEIVAARVTNLLWSARKRDEVPPHLLVLEEAHNFCPERGVGNALSGAVIRTVASEGRKFGMGLVIVSQRPAKIDKNVLSQCNTQVVLKVTNPNDLKALVASVEGITGSTADEVQRLPVGTALIAGGGLTQPVLVDVRPRMTRHGGASIRVVRGGRSSGPPKIQAAPEPEPEIFEDPLPVFEPEPPRPLPPPPAPKRSRPAPTPTPPSPPPSSSMPAASEPAPFTPPAKARPGYNAADKEDLWRVVQREGRVKARNADGAIAAMGAVASQYVDIGRAVCHEDAPVCIRCPLRSHCHFHHGLQQERQKQRAGIRRLWRH